MSLILDALKRAERERKLENAPDLSAIYQEGQSGRRNFRSLLLVGAVLLCAIALAIFFYWPKESDTSVLAPKRPKTVQTPSKQAKKPQPESVKKPVYAVEKTVNNKLPKPSASTVKKKQPETKKAVPTTEKPEIISRERTSRRVVEEGDLPVKRTLVSKRPEKPPNALSRAVPKTKPKKVLPLFHRLPEEIRSLSGPLEINVHMYSPNPKERRVFINMKGYREGDVIGDTGFQLVEITEDGVVIDYGKGKALLEVEGK